MIQVYEDFLQLSRKDGAIQYLISSDDQIHSQDEKAVSAQSLSQHSVLSPETVFFLKEDQTGFDGWESSSTCKPMCPSKPSHTSLLFWVFPLFSY